MGPVHADIELINGDDYRYHGHAWFSIRWVAVAVISVCTNNR